MAHLRVASYLVCFLVALAPANGVAQSGLGTSSVAEPAQISRLSDVLMIGEVMDVMRTEGLSYGEQMQTEMFGDKGSATWPGIVELIYDGAAMRGRFDAAFSKGLEGKPDAVVAAIRFFDTELGRRILALEVEARRSLLDEAVEDAAKTRVEDMVAAQDPRMEALRKFADVNELIEANVSGALNANLAFFQGLAEVGPKTEDLTEEQMLADVWGQEPEIRAETEAWLFPYLALAYGSLSNEEFQSYIAFSETEAGQALNVALFAAFDAVFSSISRDLGRAAAQQLMGQDI